MAFQILSGSSETLPASMSVASAQGWLVFGSVNQSGSVFSVIMGRGEGRSGLVTNELTHSVHAGSGSSYTASGIWQNVYPPQTATDVLVGVNTNPNKLTDRGAGSQGW